jgi:glutathione S-transferase
MKLYQFPLSPNCQKVTALAHEVGVPFETVFVDLFRGGARTPELLAMNPNGKLPILEDADFVLWESNAMLAYLAGKADRHDLSPSTPRERAEVDRWLAWLNAHLAPAIRKVAFERVVKKLGNMGPPDEAMVAEGVRDFATTAAVLEKALAGREYLCQRLSIADFALAPYLALAGPSGLDLEPYASVRSWLARMLARPSMKKTLAEAGAAPPR